MLGLWQSWGCIFSLFSHSWIILIENSLLVYFSNIVLMNFIPCILCWINLRYSLIFLNFHLLLNWNITLNFLRKTCFDINFIFIFRWFFSLNRVNLFINWIKMVYRRIFCFKRIRFWLNSWIFIIHLLFMIFICSDSFIRIIFFLNRKYTWKMSWR